MFQIHVPENWSDTLQCQYEVSPIISAARWAESSGKQKPSWVKDYPINNVYGYLTIGVNEMPYYIRCAARKENAVLAPRFMQWSANVLVSGPSTLKAKAASDIII